MSEGQFRVSAEWMKATGQGEEAKTFPVVRSYMSGHLPFAELDLGNGRTWTVCAEWRGEYV
jgi:hypothetical protein